MSWPGESGQRDNWIFCLIAARRREQIKEERRLLYVAMTRARQHLNLVQPLRFYRSNQHRHGDGHVLATRSRFIPDGILGLFDRCAHGRGARGAGASSRSTAQVDVAARMRAMWK